MITISEDILPPASNNTGSDAQYSCEGRGTRGLVIAQSFIDLVSCGFEVNGSSNLVEADLHLDVCDLQELFLSNDNEDDEEGSERAAKKQFFFYS